MSCYVSSNNNRLYVALEQTYGSVPSVTEQNRIPAVKLGARQVLEQSKRRDKTGSRTFVGLPNRIRRDTSFQLKSFMTQWSGSGQPSHGPLFQAAMGATPLSYGGGVVASMANPTSITFANVHGLTVGQGVAFGADIRFVAAVQDTTTVIINAPFSTAPVNGSAITATVTYKLDTEVGSVSIFDYWDPSTVVQRILDGSGIDTLTVSVNGDFHEFDFAGPARDLIDSVSFTSGEGGLTSFPAEPAQVGFDYTIVPGHLGQVWLGASPVQFFTLTRAELELNNNIALRTREFGSDFARCIAAGQRSVRLNFSILEQDDQQTKDLYQAARQRSPIGVMLQLGEQTGQLFGAYMPAMVPEVPEFEDAATRVEWKFTNSRAQGTVNDELYVSFA